MSKAVVASRLTMFFDYPKQHSSQPDGYAWTDAVNHCRRWQAMWVSGDRCTTAHESLHGVHSELRLSSGCNYIIQTDRPKFQASPSDIIAPALPKKVSVAYDDGVVNGNKVNAFYLLQNRAIRLPEPNIRKSHAAQYIPRNLRGDRYGVYIVGQQAWDDTPLYVYDEWVAYVGGTVAGIDLVEKGEYRDGWRDLAMGPLEFSVYGAAITMAAKEQDPSTFEAIKPFFCWLWKHAFRVYFQAAKPFPWDKQDAYLEALRTSPEAENMRSFLKGLQLTIPASLDEAPDPDKQPEKLDWMLI